MRTLPTLIFSLVALAAPGFAADDPIATRQALMDNNGASAAVAGAIMKDQVAYSPVVGKAVIVAMAATAAAYGDYFPEGSIDPARSNASPKIWEDMAGFQAELAKFQTSVAAALKASGKDGPADKDAFVAAIQPAFASCKSCHEGYRLNN